MNNLNAVMIRHSQRRLHNLVYATICINTENKIKKLYIEYSIDEYESKNKEDTKYEEEKQPASLKVPKRKLSKFAKQSEYDNEPEVTPVKR